MKENPCNNITRTTALQMDMREAWSYKERLFTHILGRAKCVNDGGDVEFGTKKMMPLQPH
jgi:hypothetical protein